MITVHLSVIILLIRHYKKPVFPTNLFIPKQSQKISLFETKAKMGSKSIKFLALLLLLSLVSVTLVSAEKPKEKPKAKPEHKPNPHFSPPPPKCAPPPPTPKATPPPPPPKATPPPPPPKASPPPPPPKATPPPPPPKASPPPPPPKASPPPPPPKASPPPPPPKASPPPPPPKATPPPPPPSPGTCTKNVHKFSVCSGFFKNGNGIGSAKQCCSLLDDISRPEAASCLCKAVHLNVFNNPSITAPVAVNKIFKACNKKPLTGFKCPSKP